MTDVPAARPWRAGDPFDAERMNEVTTQINFLRNPPMVHVARLSTSQTLTGSAWNFINFDTVQNNYDPYNMWDSGDPSAVYCTVPGWYVVQGQLALNQTSTDARVIMALYKSGQAGGNLELRAESQNFPGSGNHCWSKEWHSYLGEGDWYHMGIWFDTDASRTTPTGDIAESCRMRLRWCSN